METMTSAGRTRRSAPPAGARRRLQMAFAAGLMLIWSTTPPARSAEPGVTNTEVVLGQTMPYSGPASGYGISGRVQEAYFQMVNAKGGINGRKVKFISLDDAYNPAKTVEQTRKLVEQDDVFAMVGSLGTPTNSAVQRYLNSKKVPQVFMSTGASKWDDPKNFPYSLSLAPPYRLEGEIFGEYVRANRPNARVGIFTQNDDAGRDYIAGIRKGLGEKADSIIVSTVTYENSDPTVDSQIVKLKAAGADTLFSGGTPRIAAQVIRKIGEIGWKPFNWISAPANSIKGVLEPAGIENAKGIVTTLAYKSATDPRWRDDADVKEFRKFLADWMPQADVADSNLVTGYVAAYMTAKVLGMAAGDLTRANFLKQATSLRNVQAPMVLPGITFTTRPDRYAPFSQLQMARFDGVSWVPEGSIVSADESK